MDPSPKVELRPHPGSQYRIFVDGVPVGFAPYRRAALGNLFITAPLDPIKKAAVEKEVRAQMAAAGLPMDTIDELKAIELPEIPEAEQDDFNREVGPDGFE